MTLKDRSHSEQMKFFNARHEVMPSDCWHWTGTIRPNGYGVLHWGTTKKSAHRFVYELLIGPIPVGLHLHHRCANPPCVNPAHLEPVTHRQHMAVGTKATKTHCVNGHEFTEQNTHTRTNGTRRCRTCDLDRHKRMYAANPMPYVLRKRLERRRAKERKNEVA